MIRIALEYSDEFWPMTDLIRLVEDALGDMRPDKSIVVEHIDDATRMVIE